MTATQHTPCPMCGSDKAHTVRNKADIVACEGCGLVYLRTRPSVAALEEHYQKYASNPGSHMKLPVTQAEILSSGLRRDYLLNEIVAYTGATRGRLLDIGCGWGAFLDNARRAGFQPFGIEICREMANFANTRLGIPVSTAQLEACCYDEGVFQVVTLIHAFEHLPNQRTALETIHRLLQPDGYLVGIVPNFDSFCSRKMGDAWPWLDPEMHYSHFTPESLAKAFWSCGFNALKLWTATGDFDREIILKRGALLTGQNIQELEASGQGEELRFIAQRI